ncbi:MAG: hypothetical protein ACLQUY_13015 [Ktedonobacterales bacterium]
MGVPAGWKDDGTYLTAPNGKSVVLRFRWHILTHTWAPDDWPIESEHYEPFLDITNPQQGGGIVQHFRKRILAWQEHSDPVLELWSGAIALEWQRRAQSSTKPANALNPLPVAVPLRPIGRQLLNLPSDSAGPSAERLASLEKQVQMLLSGLGAGAKPNEVARTIQDRLDMIAVDSQTSKQQYHPFSNPRILLRWLLILIALLLGDTIAWAIPALLHRPTTLPLPLLALATVALSACFFFLLTLRPLPQT